MGGSRRALAAVGVSPCASSISSGLRGDCPLHWGRCLRVLPQSCSSFDSKCLRIRCLCRQVLYSIFLLIFLFFHSRAFLCPFLHFCPWGALTSWRMRLAASDLLFTSNLVGQCSSQWLHRVCFRRCLGLAAGSGPGWGAQWCGSQECVQDPLAPRAVSVQGTPSRGTRQPSPGAGPDGAVCWRKPPAE